MHLFCGTIETFLKAGKAYRERSETGIPGYGAAHMVYDGIQIAEHYRWLRGLVERSGEDLPRMFYENGPGSATERRAEQRAEPDHDRRGSVDLRR